MSQAVQQAAAASVPHSDLGAAETYGSGYGGTGGQGRAVRPPIARPLGPQPGGMWQYPRSSAVVPAAAPNQAPAQLQPHQAPAQLQPNQAPAQLLPQYDMAAAAATSPLGAQQYAELMSNQAPARSASPRWAHAAAAGAAPLLPPARSVSAPGSPAARVLSLAPTSGGFSSGGFSSGGGVGGTCLSGGGGDGAGDGAGANSAQSASSTATTTMATNAAYGGLPDTAAQRSPRPPIAPPRPPSAPRALATSSAAPVNAAPGSWGQELGGTRTTSLTSVTQGQARAQAPAHAPSAFFSAFASASQAPGGAFEGESEAMLPPALPADFGPADRVPSVSGPLASFPDLASMLSPSGDPFGSDLGLGRGSSLDVLAEWAPPVAVSAPAPSPAPSLAPSLAPGWPPQSLQGFMGMPAVQLADARQGAAVNLQSQAAATAQGAYGGHAQGQAGRPGGRWQAQS